MAYVSYFYPSVIANICRQITKGGVHPLTTPPLPCRYSPIVMQLAMQEAELVDIQYPCGHCGVNVDAITRQQRIKYLPPYLCLQLQRFVYDLKVSQCLSVWGTATKIRHSHCRHWEEASTI
jgi:hypothetical protein